MSKLKVGDQAPEFSIKDQNGNSVSLGDYNGKRVAIYFYPKDQTPGCTAQACNLRDNYSDLSKEGIVVLGVSADTEQSHQKFIEKFNLPFVLLSDPEKVMLEAYGVWGEKRFMGKKYMGITRTTFVLNESHQIIGIIEKPNTKDHATEIFSFYR